MPKSSFLTACEKAIGLDAVLTDPQLMLPYVTDVRKRFTGQALAVLMPKSTQEVSALLTLCTQYRVPVVPQGGNTGTVLGSVPDKTGDAVVISLRRMNQILSIDPENLTMTVEAGCILDNVRAAARDAGRFFPLSLASSGSCMIGGNLAANAGGTAVLRYGTARNLCLGLEAVLPDGSVYDGLYGLRKNNTGYDLKDLFIGSEGTLGVITAAVLKLFPLPQGRQTAFVALQSPEEALRLLNLAQGRAYDLLTTFELMSSVSLGVVFAHFPNLKSPLPGQSPYYVLMELSGTRQVQDMQEALEAILGTAFEQGMISDAAIAQSEAQAQHFWALRENIAEGQARAGKNIKHDISVPVSQIPRFMAETDRLLQDAFPGCRMTVFGHLGDGSLHYNVGAPQGMSDDAFLRRQDAVNQVVYDSVARFNGAISAEHGLGALKHDKNARYKGAAEMALMRRIKDAIDPLGIMNPGKVLP